MAKVQYYHGAGNYLDVINHIVALDERLTQAGDYDISFNGKFLLHLGGGNNIPFWIIINGSVPAEGASIRALNGYHLYSVIGEKFMFIKICNEDKTLSNIVAYVETDGGDFYGGIRGDVSSNNGLEALTTYNIDNIQSYGYFPKMINFALPVGEIAYSSYTPFAGSPSGGSLLANISELLSSSSVTIDSTISIGQDNYYCVGSNTIVKIDQQ